VEDNLKIRSAGGWGGRQAMRQKRRIAVTCTSPLSEGSLQAGLTNHLLCSLGGFIWHPGILTRS